MWSKQLGWGLMAWLCVGICWKPTGGQDGPPELPMASRNSVRVRSLAETLRAPARGAANAGKDKKAEAKGARETKAIDLGDKSSAKGVMTMDTLLEMLKGLGYEIDTQSTTKDWIYVRFSHSSLTYTAALTISGSKRFIWLMQPLVSLERAQDVPQPALVKLLEESQVRSPAFFRISSKHLYMAQAMDNHDVTPAALRWTVDFFDRAVEDAFPVWNPAVLLPPPAITDSAAAKPERERLNGTWKVLSLTQEGKTNDTRENDIAFIFAGTKVITHNGDSNVEGSLALPDVSNGEKAMDMYGSGGVINLGIYRLEGSSLTICFGLNKERPTKFSAEAGSNCILLVCQKVK